MIASAPLQLSPAPDGTRSPRAVPGRTGLTTPPARSETRRGSVEVETAGHHPLQDRSPARRRRKPPETQLGRRSRVDGAVEEERDDLPERVRVDVLDRGDGRERRRAGRRRARDPRPVDRGAEDELGRPDRQPGRREGPFPHRNAAEPDAREAALPVGEEDVEPHRAGSPALDRHLEPRLPADAPPGSIRRLRAPRDEGAPRRAPLGARSPPRGRRTFPRRSARRSAGGARPDRQDPSTRGSRSQARPASARGTPAPRSPPRRRASPGRRRSFPRSGGAPRGWRPRPPPARVRGS